jgi:uncharacterized membrane protein YhaH (DUF805 family)
MSFPVFLGRWLDPRVPIGRASFLAFQVLGVLIERFLSHWLRLTEIPQAASRLGFVACVIVLFATLALLALKRLTDVGWSWTWAVAVLGPVVLDTTVAMGNAEISLIRVLAYLSMVWYVGYIALAVVLCIAPSEEIERRVARP